MFETWVTGIATVNDPFGLPEIVYMSARIVRAADLIVNLGPIGFKDLFKAC